jgi:hypothetical protein
MWSPWWLPHAAGVLLAGSGLFEANVSRKCFTTLLLVAIAFLRFEAMHLLWSQVIDIRITYLRVVPQIIVLQ